MLDGIYQSVITFFMAYLVFAPAATVTYNGLDISDRNRIGVYVGCASIVVVNVYILLNSYRWDWLLLLLVGISILLFWFWTGVYSSFTGAEYFYKAAAEVFAQPSYWALTFVSIVICLLPRLLVKFVQKMYFPYDVDIIREQVRQGKFAYLTNGGLASTMRKSEENSTASSETQGKHSYPRDDDQRPIYPPSVAATATTHNRSQAGSDGTDYTKHRMSLEVPHEQPMRNPRLSLDRPRPSYDRMRASMDRMRPSFEQSGDITSAAMLTRMESSQSFEPGFGPVISNRRHNLSRDISRELAYPREGGRSS